MTDGWNYGDSKTYILLTIPDGRIKINRKYCLDSISKNKYFLDLYNRFIINNILQIMYL